MPSEGLTQLLRLHMALVNFPLMDVVESRATLERASARLAARRATEEHLVRMREELAQMDVAGLSRERFNDHDTNFHVAIAEAGGNRLMTDMTLAVRNAVRHPLLRAFHRIEDWESVAARLRAEHHAVYDAIAAGDSQRAGELVEAHARDFHHDIFSTVLDESEPAPDDPGPR